MSAKPVTLVPDISSHENASQLEQEHVHNVYDHIAPHFSQTRYKPWPVVSAFLSSIPTGWVGLDSGTGNGKYLPLPLDRPGCSWTIGLDRSPNLLRFAKIAGGKSHEVVLGDAMECPWRREIFDYALSIATIHHFSTPERRKRAVQSLLLSLSPSHGRALIYVWATQQDELSKRSIPSKPQNSSNQHDSQLDAQSVIGRDVFVPWMLKSEAQSGGPGILAQETQPIPKNDTLLAKPQDAESIAFNRYYHMFDHGELRQLVKEAASDLGIEERAGKDESANALHRSDPSMRTFLEFVQDGWERSNYFVELRLRTMAITPSA